LQSGKANETDFGHVTVVFVGDFSSLQVRIRRRRELQSASICCLSAQISSYFVKSDSSQESCSRLA
jgi:hypothetical protein